MKHIMQLVQEFRMLDEKQRNGSHFSQQDRYRLRDLREQLDRHFGRKTNRPSPQEAHKKAETTFPNNLRQRTPRHLSQLPEEMVDNLRILYALEQRRRKSSLSPEEELVFQSQLNQLFTWLPQTNNEEGWFRTTQGNDSTLSRSDSYASLSLSTPNNEATKSRRSAEPKNLLFDTYGSKAQLENADESSIPSRDQLATFTNQVQYAAMKERSPTHMGPTNLPSPPIPMPPPAPSSPSEEDDSKMTRKAWVFQPPPETTETANNEQNPFLEAASSSHPQIVDLESLLPPEELTKEEAKPNFLDEEDDDSPFLFNPTHSFDTLFAADDEPKKK